MKKPMVSRIDSRQTSPVENYLTEIRDLDRVQSVMHKISSQRRDWGLVEYLTAHLGADFYQWTGEFRFRVWDKPTYRVFANKKKGICLEIPEEQGSREKALDALQQFLADLNLDEHKLPGSEVARIEDVAVAALNGEVFGIPLLPEDKLRQFVDDLCSGRVYTDRDAGRDTNMVFMVLMFMSPDLKVVAAAEAAAPSPGVRPESLRPPDKEPDDKLPVQPPEPDALKAEYARRESIVRDIEWGLSQQDKLDEYIRDRDAVAEDQNKRLREEWDAKVIAWEKECKVIEDGNLKKVADHKAATDKYIKDTEALRAKTVEWELADERHNTAFAAAQSRFMSPVGAIWEYLSQAGPSSINGHPVFFSGHFMHKDDWARAVKAVPKEIARRKKMKL